MTGSASRLPPERQDERRARESSQPRARSHSARLRGRRGVAAWRRRSWTRTRRRAAQQLSQLGWPSARDEQWRYANLRAYERVAAFRPKALDTGSELATADQPAAALLIAELPPVLPGFERLLYVDGVRYAAAAGAPAATSSRSGRPISAWACCVTCSPAMPPCCASVARRRSKYCSSPASAPPAPPATRAWR